MKRLIAWNMVTLDGFFSALDGNLDWFVFDDELDCYSRIGERFGRDGRGSFERHCGTDS